MNLRKDHYRLPTGPRDAGRRLVALFRLRTPRGSSRPGGPSLGVAVVGGWRRRRASGLPLLRVREAFRAYVRFLPSASPSGFLRAGLSRGTASPSRWRRGLPVGVCGPFPKPPHPLSGGGKGAEGAGGGPLRWASRSAGGASCLSNTPERVPGVVLLSAPVSPCSPRGWRRSAVAPRVRLLGLGLVSDRTLSAHRPPSTRVTRPDRPAPRADGLDVSGALAGGGGEAPGPVPPGPGPPLSEP